MFEPGKEEEFMLRIFTDHRSVIKKEGLGSREDLNEF